MRKTVDTYITFGVQYKEHPTDEGEAHPDGMFGEGYAVIEAPSREVARAIAHAVFHDKWAFDYSEPPKPEYAPAGEILRIAWIDNGALKSARHAIEESYQDFELLDEENEALQNVRQILEERIGEGR